jgi:Fibronectin type III domain./Ricin-type beta-trefoil lectin domain.
VRITNKPAIILGLVVLLTLSGAGASFAYFTSGVTASGTVNAGAVGVTQTLSSSLLSAAAFKSTNTAVTGSVTVQNTGSVSATYRSSVPALASGSSSALASQVTVAAWPNTAGTDCATQTKPGSAVTSTWQQLSLSGTLAAGASAQYCLQTALDVWNAVSGIPSGSTVKPNVSTALSAGTNWNVTSATQTATLTFIDDIAPSVPGSLSVSSVSSTGATLTWTASTDNVGVIGYHVYRNGTLVSGTTPISATTFTDSGLASMTTYTYTVTAVDAAGNASAAATVSATTPPNSTTSHTIATANGECIDASGVSYGTSDYQLVSSNCNQSGSQSWEFVSDGTGMTVQSTWTKQGHQGLVWDVAGGSTTAGAGIVTAPSNGGATQRWLIASLGGGTYQFKNTGSGLCLQMPPGNNVQITQEACNASSSAQIFSVQ